MVFLAALGSFLYFILSCHADPASFYANTDYNAGIYGDYVTRVFTSNPQVTGVPVVNFMKPFTDCDDGSHLFVAPRGAKADATPMILDIHGRPVWVSEKKYGEVYNLQAQEYKGKQYLTFWAGNDAVGGHGIGEYFMLDQHYNEQFRIKAANGLGADLHAFTITKDNTALISIYQAIAVDISSVAEARSHGWMWDSVFQEIDIETGEALFEWRTSTHIPITNSYTDVNRATEDDPWDAYHINSVEKDDAGNYLVSLRFLRAMLYVDGKTGDVLWQLGGKANSFQDLSGGEATSFAGQHDAHWQDGHKYITVFDNRGDWYHKGSDESRGVRIAIDLDKMTAKLDQAFVDPFNKIFSMSQGSYQTLPNGNVVLGYGFNGVIAEFSSSGELLCDMYMQPSSTFESGIVQSYRNLRYNWTGLPDTKPSLALDSAKLYMSWNGATEVSTWLLISSHEAPADFVERKKAMVGSSVVHIDAPVQKKVMVGKSVVHIDAPAQKKTIVGSDTIHLEARDGAGAIAVVKDGFETVLSLKKDYGLRQYVQMIALDRNGSPLGTSNIVDIGDLASVDPHDKVEEDQDSESADDWDNEAFAAQKDDAEQTEEPTGLAKDMEDVQTIVFFAVLAVISGLLSVCFALGTDKFLQPWKSMVLSRTQHEYGPVQIEGEDQTWPMGSRKNGRVAYLLQRMRKIVPMLRQRGTDTDASIREGLLADEDILGDPAAAEVQHLGSVSRGAAECSKW